MIQFLPLSSFHHLADLALHQITLQGADVTDVELAMQMFSFVKEGSGKQFLPRFLVPLSVYILGTNRHLARPADRLAKFRNAQSAFGLSMFALGVKNLRIRQH